MPRALHVALREELVPAKSQARLRAAALERSVELRLAAHDLGSLATRSLTLNGKRERIADGARWRPTVGRKKNDGISRTHETRCPRPPPPKAALISTGNPAAAANCRAAAASALGAPGTTGTWVANKDWG